MGQINLQMEEKQSGPNEMKLQHISGIYPLFDETKNEEDE